MDVPSTSTIDINIREDIISKLKQQNEKANRFQTIFKSHQQLTERISIMKLNHERVRQSSASDANPSNDEFQRLKNELNEVYRLKAINDQQLIETNNRLQESEKKLVQLQRQINEREEELKISRRAMESLEQKERETIQSMNILRDEHIALQAEHNILEEKYYKIESDNKELVERWIQLKSQQCDEINSENVKAAKAIEQKMQRDLSEAASVYVPIDDGKVIQLPTAEGSSLPITCDDVLPLKCVARWQAHSGEVTSIRWSPQGQKLATGGSDRRIHLFSLSYGYKPEKRHTLNGCNQSIMSMAFNAQDERLIAASNDNCLRWWTVSDERCRSVLTGHSSKVFAVKFHAQGSQAVSGSADKTIKVWDIQMQRCTRTLFCGSTVHDLLTNDGSVNAIISAHYDSKIRVYDPRVNEPLKEIQLAGKVTSLDSGQDASTVLASTREDTLMLIDMRTYKILHTYSGEAFHCTSDYTRSCISPLGGFVSCGSSDGHLFIWNSDSTRLEKCLHKNSHDGSPIVAASWHAMGHLVATCDKKGFVCVWAEQ